MIEWLKGFSKKQMLLTTVLTYIGYFMITILGPILTICIKFDLFNAAKQSRLKISGWALILLMIATVVSLFILRRVLNKMKDTRPANAYFKYTLKTISNCILPVIGFFVIYLLKEDYETTLSTARLLCVFYLTGGILDGAFISFIDRENNIRDGALFDKEKDSRRHLV